MSTLILHLAPTRSALRKAGCALAATAAVLIASNAARADVSQTPLYLGGGNVPGNLTLVPSVEWPTINSVANLGDYADTREYLGYFDPNKCYLYNYDANEALRYFYPSSAAASHRCSGKWSGNFMNWAATQTIDPFRSVLTGGYRVKDTPTETWLEKARHDGQGGSGIYPNRRIPVSGNNSTMVKGATPFNVNWIRMRIESLGNKMRFRITNDDTNTGVVPYNPGVGLLNIPYEVSVRVKVCVSGMLESNCRQYSQGWKPEGLIQQYSDELRVGVFGYLNDPTMLRDGGALRAREAFVGQTMMVPGGSQTTNTAPEWDSVTGVLTTNPDPADATATTNEFSTSVVNSGVINYLNKFGELTTNTHKSYDPVSELYYTALRYLKHQGNVPEYTSMAGATDPNRARYADGFPVITSWEDPIQYACQKNVILGIGDVNTHRDKNLPGSTYGTDEPAKPSLVSNDTTVNVLTWTDRVGQLEGLGNIADTNNWSGRNNSAYLAGLAYYANTTDIRDDIPGTQTVSTHWVDVLEAQTLEAPVENQYYLATKYGGFNVPSDTTFDPATNTDPLPTEWWHTNLDTLTSFGVNSNPAGYNFLRPDNYYLAGSATQMVSSLTNAFARISIELRSSASSVAANSTRVDTDTAVFQAAFDSHRWSGEVLAYRIDDNGAIAGSPQWNAATKLDALSAAGVTSRKIYTATPPTAAGGGSLVSTTGIAFQWGSLDSSQQAALKQLPNGGTVSDAEAQQRLDYLRGVRTNEKPTGAMRQRDSRLGDIVNSNPQFIHDQDFGYTLLSESGAFSSSVASAYRTFRQSSAYQSRAPAVIVGANDGMLHIFNGGLDANGGKELFAFVPNAAFAHLYELTQPAYAHRYFVDGTPRVADAWLGSGPGWRTLAVGTTGAGGHSVFALDITDPGSMTSSSVLWEFTHPDMGFPLIQPSVAPLPNGMFGVVVTSGYSAPSGGGHIWFLNPANGSIIRSISLPDSGDLGAPLLADLNGDRVADRVYVGDTNGNLWRIDLASSDPNEWAPPTDLLSGSNPIPLFVATDANGDPQAITAPPTSAFNDRGEHMVFFGTGSFYRVDDNVVPDDPQVDSFYGIIDRDVPISGRDELVEQEILTEQTDGERVRGVTANPIEPENSGWFLDLLWKNTYGGPGALGERVVTGALVRGDRVIFTTLIPNTDPCAYGGDSWLMELNAFYGGRLDYAVFDLDVDGDFDHDDWITVELPDGSEIEIPPSAVAPDIGIMQPPAVISGIGDDQDEIKVVSGSSGQLMRISERGGINIGRQSWRQQR